MQKSVSGHKSKGNTKQEPQINHAKTNNIASHVDPNLVSLIAPIHKNTMLVKIGGQKTQALVDTGASISCISKAFLEKTGLNISKFQNCNLKEIIGVGGEKHKILGKVEVPILVSGIKITSSFYVLNVLHHSVILGVDFLEHHKVNIDFNNGKIYLKDKVFSASLITTKGGFARVDRPTCVPAGSEIDLKVKIARRQNKEIVLLEPVKYLHDSSIGGAKCLVTVRKGRAFIRVMNPTSRDIELPVNKIVASVSDIHHDNVYVLDDSNTSTSSANVNQIHVSTDAHPQGKNIDFEISNENLSRSEIEQLKTFLHQNEDVFSTSLADIGKTNLFKHRIDTDPNAPPVHLPCYRQPPHLKEETERQVKDMLQQGIVEQSMSVYNSPVVLVRKKDNTWRFAVDYRKLNKITTAISHPIPRLDDVFDALGQAQASYFSILDLNSAYFQIELDPETRHKSAFVTHDGVYEFTRMPFGLRNAPMSFQMLMSQVLKGLNWKFVLCYIDDILVFSSTFDEHIEHLGQVFQRLREANLTLKPSKCKFAVEQVVYLGHTITHDGVSVDIEKTEKVRSFPTPTTQKQLKQFLGLCNYYGRFVKDYAKICIPLNRPLKKDKKQKFATGDWSTDCEKAFQTLKTALTSPPILGYPDMNKPFILTTDSSGSAIGYILGQKDSKGREFVVAYGGRALRPDEKKWSVTEQECLAVIVGIETYKHYLSCNRFTVYTDHKALQWLNNIKDPTGRLGRWALRLQGIDFEIIHRKGSKNQNADALSRIPYESAMADQSLSDTIAQSSRAPALAPPSEVDANTISINSSSHARNEIVAPIMEEESMCQESEFIELHLEYQETPEVAILEPEVQQPEPDMAELQENSRDFKAIFLYLKDQSLPENDKQAKFIVSEANQYVLRDGIMYHIFQPRMKHKDKDNTDQLVLQLALPEEKRSEVLKAYHDCLAGGGHFGVTKTFGSIRLKYWWPKMYQEIQNYVQNCDICQRIKTDRHRLPAPLHPLPVEETFSRVHIDILCSLPKTKEGFQYILVIVDSFSKWCESFPMQTQEATEVALILYNEIFTRFGAPRCIVSDRGRQFMSKLVKALCEMFRVTRHYTSSYHPQTNATVERVNSTLSQTLRAYVRKDQSNWPSLLPSIMMAFRSTPCTESHQFTPYHLLFGKEMNLPIDTTLIPKPTLGQNAKQYFDQLLEKLKVSQEIATKNMEVAREKAKIRHDVRSQEPTFQLNDLVLLKSVRVDEGLSVKLGDKSLGPYYIVELCPNHTYRLRSCANHKLVQSPVHANRIKLYRVHPNEPIPVPDVRNPPPPDQHLPQLGTQARTEDQQMVNPSNAEHDNQNKQHNQSTNHVPKNPQQSKNKPETKTTHSDTETYFPFDRLVKVRKINGKTHFLVKWKDGSPNTWEPEENISDTVLREYYSTHTKSGKRRKKKQMQFFQRSQDRQ